MGDTGRYIYAVSRGLDPAALAGTTGLGGSEVGILEHRGMQAVVSTVDLAAYGEDGLRRNLEDMAWLEATARGHDAVVRTAADHAPTAPLRLATICLDDDGVRARLEEWYAPLSEVLDRIEGRTEWSVKVYARPGEDAPAAAAPTSGAAYLRRKKEAAQARTSAREAALRCIDELDRALTDLVVARRQLAPQDPQLSGERAAMLANTAYLVERDDSDAFARRVRDLAAAESAIDITVGGPWPPYSFAVLEQA